MSSLLHIGADGGQEAESYELGGFQSVYWVEADPQTFERLRANLQRRDPSRHHSFLALIAHGSGGKRRFYRFSNGGSSSIYRANEHWGELIRDVSETGESIDLDEVSLDEFVERNSLRPAVMVIDVQGAELEVLQGGPKTLSSTIAVDVEVSVRQLYEGGALFDDVDALLRRSGFTRVSAVPWHGDVLYVRLDALTPGQRLGMHVLYLASRLRFFTYYLRRAVCQPGEVLRRLRVHRTMINSQKIETRR
jgi:FkbM family methyltransferase